MKKKQGILSGLSGLAVGAALIGCVSAPQETKEGGFLIGNEDRVAIYGDSITAGVSIQAYPRYVETYIRTRYPDWKGEAWNLGVVGDYAGNMKRYRAEGLAQDPTIITFNMGMNDVVHSNGKNFSRAIGNFMTNLTAIVTETRTNKPNAKIILCSPEPYEVRMVRGAPEKAVILRYASRQERRLAERLGVDFIDINGALYRNYGIAETFTPGAGTFTNDGVHYGPQGGHFLLAVAFLEGLGAEPHLASAEIDAATGATTGVRDVEIRDVKATAESVTFARKLAHLPFPASDWQPDATQAWADRMMYGRFEIADRLNRDLLTVKGLKAGAYAVRIDGRTYGTFAAEDLAEGVNFGEFSNSPDFEQATLLCHAVGTKQVAQRELIALKGAKKPDAAKIADAEKKLADASAAIPKVSHAGWHTIEIVPHKGAFTRWQCGQENVEILLGKTKACPGWDWTNALKAGKDGRFVGEEDLTFVNWSDRTRVVEAVMPEGFKPAAFVATIEPGTSAVCRLSWDLPPDVGPKSIKVKNYRKDGLTTPLLHQVNFTYSRRAKWQKGADGSYSATFALGLTQPGEFLRSLGPADCSGTAKVVWKDGKMSVDVDVADQSHVNVFTDTCITWDDSLSFSYGKGHSFGLALAKNGPVLEGKEKDKATYDVRREGLHTLYRLSFPCEKPEGDKPISFSVLDREVDQQVKHARWSGVIGE